MSFSFNNHFSNNNNNNTTLDIAKLATSSGQFKSDYDDDHFGFDEVVYSSYSDFPPGFSPPELLNSPFFLSSPNSNVCYTLTFCIIIIIIILFFNLWVLIFYFIKNNGQMQTKLQSHCNPNLSYYNKDYNQMRLMQI